MLPNAPPQQQHPQQSPGSTSLDTDMNFDGHFPLELLFDAPFAPPSNTPSATSAHLPATSTHTMPLPSPPTPPVDLDALLDNPLTAALLATQLKLQRASHPHPHHPQPTQPAPLPPAAQQPISKPRAKKKVRPKDRVDLLQKHLEIIVDQVKHLSLRNRQLHKKKEVLEHLVKEISRCEELAQQAQRDIAHHKAHPNEPPRGAAVYKDWTPQQFITYYKGAVGRNSKWIIDAETAVVGGDPPPEVVAQIDASNQHILEVVFYVCHAQRAFIPLVKTELFKQFPDTVSEEEHWAEVVRALELTEGQVEDLLVAREVFFSVMERMEREQEAVQAAIHQKIELASVPDSYMRVLCTDDDVVSQVAQNLRKRSGFTALLAMFVFLRALTPIQVAKCGLHAHPLFPDPIIMMNIIHAKYRQAPAVQSLLAPAPAPAPAPTPAAPQLPTASLLPHPFHPHPSPSLSLAPSCTLLGNNPVGSSSSSSRSLSLSLSLTSTTSSSGCPDTTTTTTTAAPATMTAPPPPGSLAAALLADGHSYLRLLQSPHRLPLQSCPAGRPDS